MHLHMMQGLVCLSCYANTEALGSAVFAPSNSSMVWHQYIKLVQGMGPMLMGCGCGQKPRGACKSALSSSLELVPGATQ